MVLAFGDHQLDIKRRELRRFTKLVDLPAKAFDLLAFLVQHCERVVTKDDLIREVWGGRIVSDSAITTRINAVRHALGDNGTEQRLVRTLIGRGVRFIGEVTEVPNTALRAAEPLVSLSSAAQKPSIAVLPFSNMSGDLEQEYFVDGMVEEIIAALSRIPWLFVLARESSFSYKGQSPDVRQVARELGVGYVLKGSLHKSGDRVRIHGQLMDAFNGAHLWADRFEGSFGDVFDLHDRVASSVAGVIEPTLQAAETARSVTRPPPDLTAYDLYLRACAMFLASSRQIPNALRLMEEAIERDPRYGPALGLAATLTFRILNDGRSTDEESDRANAADFARRALEVGGDDPGILANAAMALAWLGEDIDAMMALVDRALTLNPNFARGWHVAGVLRNWSGQPDSAIEHLEVALRLSPRARVGQTLHHIGMAHCFARRFAEAERKLLLALQDDPSFPTTYRVLAACYAHTGRLEEARAMVSKLLTVTRVLVSSRPPIRKAEHRNLIASGVRLAVGESGVS